MTGVNHTLPLPFSGAHVQARVVTGVKDLPYPAG
jgi:hypothetical protein